MWHRGICTNAADNKLCSRYSTLGQIPHSKAAAGGNRNLLRSLILNPLEEKTEATYNNNIPFNEYKVQERKHTAFKKRTIMELLTWETQIHSIMSKIPPLLLCTSRMQRQSHTHFIQVTMLLDASKI
jgi:hypothetical protein